MVFKLRNWQQECIQKYFSAEKRIFSCVACPGSGKTQLGLSLFQKLKAKDIVNTLIITVHTASLRSQWIEAAKVMGICLSDSIDSTFEGAVLTHQQYSKDKDFIGNIGNIASICKKNKVLLISDEHHHLADSKAWGEAMIQGFGDCSRILLLSGTLFRHDDGVIPFLAYDDQGVSNPDYEYSYQQALADRVVSPVYFPVYGGKAEWRHGSEGSIASFGDDLSLIQQNRQLNTAIASDQWLEIVLTEAVERLLLLQNTHPTAAGLVIAKDQDHARKLASLLQKITAKEPLVAISDESQSHKLIADFGQDSSTDSWIISVKMISEGIDIRRLRVGIFSTNVTTELFYSNSHSHEVHLT